MNQFSFILVKAKDHLEGQTRLLTLSDGERIGWVFPINALVDRSYLPDEKWAKVYANFALNATITLPEFIEFSNNPELSSDGVYNLLDFYSQEFAVVVLGNQAITANNLGLNHISLLLMQHGYLAVNRNMNPQNAFVDSLISMYYRALHDENPCLCYFSLYQTIEILLLKVFETAIKIYGENETIKKNPWLLREKFSDIAAEKWRLDALILH